MAAESLSPFVYWGQNNEFVFLKVDLKDSEAPEVSLDEDGLNFKANGVGVRGRHDYSFYLEFYLPIEKESSKFRVTDRNIEFQVKKQGVGEIWPRLTVSQQKIGWLKIDFDKFATGDDSEDDTNKNELDTKAQEEDLWKKLDRDLKSTEQEATADIKMLWLFIYNMFQWVGYSYVFLGLTWKYAKEGEESKKTAMASVGAQLIVCQMAAVLEIIHPMVGFVKSGVLMPLVQWCGRNLVLFMVILPELHLHTEESVWWLFVVWSAVEVIRYPFYMLSSLGKESSVITWLRYTVWIPLYPLGFALEILVILTAVPLYEMSGKFSVELPNMYNMAFHFPVYLRIHIVILLAGGYTLIKRMYSQRQKRLGSSSKKYVKSKTS